MNLTFERATAADAEALVAAQIAAFHHDAVLYPGVEIGGPPGYDSVEDMRRRMAEGQCYKMLDTGQIAGGMVVFDMGAGHVHLGVIFIDPAHQNRGLGTQALQFLERTYTDATRWTLDTPTWAIRNQHFYEKLGYVKVGEEVLPDITLIQYEKRLS
jgi:GNAT superfamily N-acetyltransferase